MIIEARYRLFAKFRSRIRRFPPYVDFPGCGVRGILKSFRIIDGRSDRLANRRTVERCSLRALKDGNKRRAGSADFQEVCRDFRSAFIEDDKVGLPDALRRDDQQPPALHRNIGDGGIADDDHSGIGFKAKKLRLIKRQI